MDDAFFIPATIYRRVTPSSPEPQIAAGSGRGGEEHDPARTKMILLRFEVQRAVVLYETETKKYLGNFDKQPQNK